MVRQFRRVQAGLLFGLFLGGCTSDAPPQLVVFAVMDAARGDRVSYAGYDRETTPFLDSLARDRALVALEHFSQGAATRSAMPRLFYSRYFVPPLFPASSKVPIEGPRGLFSRLDDRALSIPTAFADNGFATIGVSAHSWMRPGTELVGLFDEFHDLSLGHDGAYPEASVVVDTALSVVLEEPDGSVFLYLHFMDTHWPYRFGSRARAFFGDRAPPKDSLTMAKISGSERELTDLERDYYNALYDGSLRRMDDELQRFFETVKASSSWRDVSLVVTSDHGEHLGEVSGRSTHGGRWFDAVAHIPLLVAAPSRLGERITIDRPTESVDVLPTLAEVFDLSVAAGVEFDGESLAGGHTDGLALSPDAFRTAKEKVLGVEPEIPLWQQDSAPEFYLLDSDPLETNDRATEHADRVEELISLHEGMLSHSYHRFRNAKTRTPPKLPFAIASKNFVVSPRLPEDGSSSAAGWSFEGGQSHYRISCVQPPCDAIELTFPMPDGEYLMTVGHLGSGQLEVEGGDHSGYVELAGTPEKVTRSMLEQPWHYDLSTTTYGTVQVTGQKFAARLRVPTGSGFVIRHLGFIPRGAAIDSDQESYEARLKALGYLQ